MPAEKVSAKQQQRPAPQMNETQLRGVPMPQARVIAVTSGKGGVGKTNISVNLALALARMGKRVILWDMDLGLANVDVLLKLDVQHDLSHVLNGKAHIEEIMLDAPARLKVIPGASGDEQLANLNEKQRNFLIEALEYLTHEADYIILDTGAGIADNILRFTTAADDVIVVTTPEPTAMVDAYATIKLVHRIRPEGNIHLLVNMARDAREARLALRRISSIAEHFISSHLKDDGYILYDRVVGDSVRHRKPFLIAYPDSQASRAISAIAYTINATPPPTHKTGGPKSPPGFLQRLVQRLTGT